MVLVRSVEGRVGLVEAKGFGFTKIYVCGHQQPRIDFYGVIHRKSVCYYFLSDDYAYLSSKTVNSA